MKQVNKMSSKILFSLQCIYMMKLGAYEITFMEITVISLRPGHTKSTKIVFYKKHSLLMGINSIGDRLLATTKFQ